MALQGKPVAIGNSATTIYTCPGGTEAAVHGLIFANNTGGALTVDLAFYDQTTGTTVTVATDLSVAANSYITWAKPINMNAGDYIQATSSASSGLVCLFSAYEGSAAPVATGFTGRGVWSSASTYAINDIVTVVGTGTYLAIQASTNQNPTSATAYWMFLEGISASALPSQAGQAGKYLTTDGTDASWAALDVAGGGTVTNPMSANVTLTSSSTRIQVFYPSAGGLTVTLPAASSLSEGDSFTIINKGGVNGITILNSSAITLAFVSPGKCLKLFLADVATSDWEGTVTDSVPGIAVTFISPAISYGTNQFYGSKIQKLGTNSYRAIYARQSSNVQLGFFEFTLTPAGVYTLTNGPYEAGGGDYGDNNSSINEIEAIDTNVYTHCGYGNSPYYGRVRIFEATASSSVTRYQSDILTAKTDIYSQCTVQANGRKFVHFGAAYFNQSDTGPRARVVDASSSLTAPTLGTETVLNFGSTAGTSIAVACKLDTDKGLIFSGSKPTNDSTANITPKIAVWTTSGTSISIGTVVTLDTNFVFSANPGGRAKVLALSTTEAVAAWYSTDGKLYARHLTISGTSISLGALTQLGGLAQANIVLSKISATQFLITQVNSLDLNKGYLLGVNVSGTSLSVGFTSRVSEFAFTDTTSGPSYLDSTKQALLQFLPGVTTAYVSEAVLSSI